MLTHIKFFSASLPFIISSAAVPLMGSIDTAVAGHLGNAYYINAVALGAVIFSTIYWLFNFLRLTSAGFASQAFGKNDNEEELYTYFRGSLLSFAIGILCIIFKSQILYIALYIFSPPEPTNEYIYTYFSIIIYTVPFALSYQTAQGWLSGIMQIKSSVFLGIFSNFINACLNFAFVYLLDMKIEGIAFATAIANILAFLLSLYYFFKYCPYPLNNLKWDRVLSGQPFSKLLCCSSHLSIRTLCMLLMINSFMYQSSAFGSQILAVNSILLQIQYIMGDLLTGFSQSATIFSGIAVGKQDKNLLKRTICISGIQSMTLAIMLGVIYTIWAKDFIGLFTNLSDVLHSALKYHIFIGVFPLFACLGIVYYGIFNGALQTTPICISMIFTIISYLASFVILVPTYGNIGLWLSFLVFYFVRTCSLLLFLPSFLQRFPYTSTTTTSFINK